MTDDRRLRGALRDGFGRQFEYLRLSLTDRCNFRCTYCLPHGFRKNSDLPPELTRDELRRAVEGFARLGLWKLRLTGGEPSVRPDFDALLADFAQIPGVRKIAMTTNGYRLAERALDWRRAGLAAINVSIDTLDPATFARITGHDRLKSILEGIDRAVEANFDAVKINSVLMRSLENRQWDDIVEFVASRPVTWRFIELMRTNDNVEMHEAEATPGAKLAKRLFDNGWTAHRRSAGSGPAIEYSHPGSIGRIGLIAPYSPSFCDTCNRLRLSSRGKLHLCLFGDGGLDLRDLLQSDSQQDELAQRIVAALPSKARSHSLHEGRSGTTPHLASIGG